MKYDYELEFRIDSFSKGFFFRQIIIIEYIATGKLYALHPPPKKKPKRPLYVLGNGCVLQLFFCVITSIVNVELVHNLILKFRFVAVVISFHAVCN